MDFGKSKEEIKNILSSSGAVSIGVAEVSDLLPCDIPKSLKYAVSFAYKLSDAVLMTVVERPSIMYFQHYRAVNAKLDSMALDVVRYIEKSGFSAFPIAASQSRPDTHYDGVISHKAAAVRAGVGSIGKNGLLIVKCIGAGIRLCTVLTDMPLPTDLPIEESLCTNCRDCVKACPAGAILDKEFDKNHPEIRLIAPEKCSKHMKTYSDVGRGAVCGLCMVACKAQKSGK